MLDIKKMLEDHGIESREIYKGWINVNCPFCKDPSYHGGFNIRSGYYTCFRCKYHWVVDAVANIFRMSRPSASETLKKYSTDSIQTNEQFEVRAEKVNLPYGCSRMTDRHRDYLRDRNFDDRKLEREWGLLGTSNLGEYKFRIIAPVYLRGELVSYQGRDITEKQEDKYKACPKEQSVLNIKNTLYGIDKVKGNRAVVVEGITDAWRLGVGAVATFGIDYTQWQVNMLNSHFDSLCILYDNEVDALKMGRDLANQLGLIKDELNVEIVTVEGYSDCGEMSDRDARVLMKELMK